MAWMMESEHLFFLLAPASLSVVWPAMTLLIKNGPFGSEAFITCVCAFSCLKVRAHSPQML